MLQELPPEILVFHVVPNLTLVSKIRLLQTCKKFWKLKSQIDLEEEGQFWKKKLQLGLFYEALEQAIEKREFELASVLEPLCDAWMLAIGAAAKIGDLELVKYYLAKYNGEVPKGTYHRACKKASLKGHKEILDYFVQQGMVLDFHTVKFAAYEGHLDILKMADMTTPRQKTIALCIACRGGQKHIVDWLLEQGAEFPCEILAAAAQGGNVQIVKLFISLGFQNWNKGLYGASMGGHTHLAEFFIQLGADLEYARRGERIRKDVQDFMWRYSRQRVLQEDRSSHCIKLDCQKYAEQTKWCYACRSLNIRFRDHVEYGSLEQGRLDPCDCRPVTRNVSDVFF